MFFRSTSFLRLPSILSGDYLQEHLLVLKSSYFETLKVLGCGWRVVGNCNNTADISPAKPGNIVQCADLRKCVLKILVKKNASNVKERTLVTTHLSCSFCKLTIPLSEVAFLHDQSRIASSLPCPVIFVLWLSINPCREHLIVLFHPCHVWSGRPRGTRGCREGIAQC